MKFSYSLIKKLVPRVPPKKELAEALNLHSFEVESVIGDTLDIKLPANRYSDAASHIGIAREAAAVFGVKFESPLAIIVNPPRDEGLLEINIQSQKLCPRYIGRYFEIPSTHSTRSGQAGLGKTPAWIEKVLRDCGLKPINYVVDLMNYVMLETGQPLHAFDADKLEAKKKKKVIVRLAKNGEKIETLDGQHITLDAKTLVIADAKRALALAGMKGGHYAGVGKNTKHIVVEAANFDSTNIYKTSRRLKLATDASQRFSHDISSELACVGMDRVTVLLKKAGAKLLDSADIYPKPEAEKVIGFSMARYRKLIGGDIAAEKAKKYFQKLGFFMQPPKKATDDFLVRVPAWRRDVENFEDLAEETARLVGYGRLTPQPPSVRLRSAEEDHLVRFREKAYRTLLALQLDEVYNQSFVSEDEGQRANMLGWRAVQLENPMSSECAFLRHSLGSGILKNIEDNARFFDRVAIFEIGKVFGSMNGEAKERLFLGIGLAAKDQHDVALELKGIVSEFLYGIGLIDFTMKDLHDALRIEVGRHVVGKLQSISHLGKAWTGSLCEIDMEKLLSLAEEEKEFEPLSKYPAVMRDVSLLVSQSVRIGGILEVIQGTSPILVENVDLIDEYTDPSWSGDPSIALGASKRSLTFRIVFQAKERTLTDREVDKEMEKITAALKKKFHAEVR